MATLREYFDKDFTYALSAHQEQTIKSADGTLDANILARVHLDFNSNTKFLSYYVPSNARVFDACAALLHNPEWADKITEGVIVTSGFVGEKHSNSSELKFSGRVFLYLEDELTPEQKTGLNQLALVVGVSLRIRSQAFVRERSRLEKPLAFISHDSRNKPEMARPLAIQLSRMMCPVWFDEFTLRVGASLRESIERGITECRKCILLITPEFLTNDGWTKREFDSVFTREILEREKVVLPVWHRVSVRDVYEYSPSLADRVGIEWSLGVEEVARRLYREITEEPKR